MIAARLLILVISLSVFASALGVVFSTHQARRLFVELQGLQKIGDELQVHWGLLQLEQSTVVANGNIETSARDRLKMIIPPHDSIILVHP